MSLRTAAIVSVMLTIIGAAVLLRGATFNLPGNQQGYAPAQPVNFSHRLHAGDNKIPCLYCHSSAEKSSVAGVPAVSTCMNCHSQIRKDSPEIQKLAVAQAENRPIQWTRIHSLPNYVRFNHSRHVSVGVNCSDCHGQVETMDRVAQFQTLSMGMCINCHRTHRQITVNEFGKPVISDEAARARLQASTDCSVCHY